MQQQQVVQPTVLPAFVVNPKRIGGVEMFCRELSVQLAASGWNSVLCFTAEPPEPVRRFLTLPNVSIEVDPRLGQCSRESIGGFSRILSRHRPRILHMHFIPYVTQYPWLARLHSVGSSYMTDHISRPEGPISRQAGFLKRATAGAANWPLTNLIAVSDFNARECAATALAVPRKIVRIYNGVDLSRVPAVSVPECAPTPPEPTSPALFLAQNAIAILFAAPHTQNLYACHPFR